MAIMDSSSTVVTFISSPSSTGVSGSMIGLEEVGTGASSGALNQMFVTAEQETTHISKTVSKP